jgi:soluble lytic murein transglycosylase
VNRSLAVLLFASCAALAAPDDEVFLDAREAFQRGDIARLDRLAKQLDDDYPLAPDVQYWQLRSRLADLSPGEIKNFLARYNNSLVADRLRADWLRQLAKIATGRVSCANTAAHHRRPRAALLCVSGAPGAGRVRDSDAGTAAVVHRAGPRGELPALVRVDVQERHTHRRGHVDADPACAGNRQLERRQDVARISAGSATPGSKNAGVDIAPAATVSGPLPAADEDPRPARTGDLRAVQDRGKLAADRRRPAAPNRQGIAGRRARVRVGANRLGAARNLHPDALTWFRNAGNGINDRQLTWRARAALRAGNWNEVLAAIEAMSPAEYKWPQWRYWKARALSALGRQAEANALLAPLSNQFNFYGQLAAEELGTSISTLPQTYGPTTTKSRHRQRPGIVRALTLYRIGLRYEGALEWQWAIKDYEDKQLLAAAELASRNQWYERAIDTA